jgi:hypothetical protein
VLNPAAAAAAAISTTVPFSLCPHFRDSRCLKLILDLFSLC